MVGEGTLTPQSYLVLRKKATEPGHAVKVRNGGFDDHEDEGTYVCAGCR
jgi:peptide methionine sulfoxide reductase MsrB